jgi:membrane fusion protein, multidrug efflux system
MRRLSLPNTVSAGRLVIVATALGAIASLAGCGDGEAKNATDDAASAAVPVEVERPTRGDMLAVYSGTAPILADEEATVIAKVAGEVRQILVEEGDAVKSGQVLARLDGDRLKLEVQQSQANLRKLERDYNRNLELVKKGLVAQGAIDNIRFEMEALKAAHELARLELSYTEIRAPIAGVISARYVKVGNTIEQNAPTFRVTDLDPLIAEVHVPEREFRKLSTGQSAEIAVDALGTDRFEATVKRISPTLDPDSGTFKTTLEIPDPGHRLKPGMFARVTIVVERRAKALKIPRSAIVEGDGAQSVFVIEDAVAEQRPIQTGLTNAGWIEVVEGLKGDEQVVVVGQNGLKSGNAVQVVSLKSEKS